jgi:hypothetical protein
MSITKNVFIVNCERINFEKYFSKKRNSDVINWKDIKDKLTNNDALKIPPSQQIVEFQVIKKINSFSKCKRLEFLYYYTEKLNDEIIENVKTFFKGCQFPINYHLITNGLNESDVSDNFESIQLLEDDKIRDIK